MVYTYTIKKHGEHTERGIDMTNLERNVYEEVASRIEHLSALREMKPNDTAEAVTIAHIRREHKMVVKSLYLIMKFSETAENYDMLYTFNAIRRYAEAYGIGIKDAIRYIDDHDLKLKDIEEYILEKNGELFGDEEGTYDAQKLQDYITSIPWSNVMCA